MDTFQLKVLDAFYRWADRVISYEKAGDKKKAQQCREVRDVWFILLMTEGA